jgi:hypothetical protein
MAGPQRPFPRRTLEQALRVPQALREHNGGQPWPSEEVAKSLSLGPKSGNFWYLTAAAQAYGLTEGTRETAEIKLTDLGRQAVYPDSADVEQLALRTAFLQVDSFRGVLEHYGGTNLPDKQYRENTLLTKFNLDPAVQDEFVELLNKNAAFVGIGSSFDGSTTGTATGLGTAGVATRVAGAPGDTQTVATPSKKAAGVCFVIMPFVERDEDRYPSGFFSEVLRSLFSPAITDVGLEVRTARRSGSDVIQATIVRELLTADLVLCDLTEHNPNVLFELGVRMAKELPTVLVRAKGTGRIFDVDNLLRVEEYSPNLWPKTVAEDLPRLQSHIQAGWDNRKDANTYISILTNQPS